MSWVFKTGAYQESLPGQTETDFRKRGKVEKVRSVYQLDQDTTNNQPSDDSDADTYVV